LFVFIHVFSQHGIDYGEFNHNLVAGM